MASQLLQYLPAIYTEALQEAPFLDAYLQAFEQVLLGRADPSHPPPEGLEQTIAGLERFVDPERVPEGFLPWLAGWVALSLRADLSLKQQRVFVANIVQLYRKRGTHESLRRLLQIFTTLTPTITEEAMLPEFQLRVHSTVGQDTYLSGGRPHRFQVTIDFRTVVCINEVLPLSIGLRDDRGNPAVSEATEEAVQLTIWDGLETSPTTRKAQLYIPDGQTAVAFYYKPTAAGNVSLMAESSYGNATLAITVIAPPVEPALQTQLAIEGDTVIPPGEVLPLTIARRDMHGNPTTSQSALTVELTFEPRLGACTTLGAMDFEQSMTSITIPAGETSAVILYEADAVGNLLLTATAQGLQSATRAITITDGVRDSATRLAMTGATMAGALSVDRQRAIVQALIELEKPAHTDYELLLRYPTMQLGVHSTVGLDTLLTPEWKGEP